MRVCRAEGFEMRREIAVTASASLQLCSRGDGRWGGHRRVGVSQGGLGWQIGGAAQCGAGFGDVQGLSVLPMD